MGRFVFALSALICAVAAHAEPRVALVIGNGNYGGTLGPLKNPTNDAARIETALRAVGFAVVRRDNVDRRGMMQALQELGESARKAGPEATALFYYAGHGIEYQGINYLIPTGAPITRAADLEIEAVPADFVLAQFKFYNAAKGLIFIDACRNMPLARGIRSASQGFVKPVAPEGHQTYILHSTSPGETALDGDDGLSPFASAVAARIAEPNVSIEEFSRLVKSDVYRATAGKQEPRSDSSIRDKFQFVVKLDVVVTVGVEKPSAAYPGVTGKTMLDFATLPTASAADRRIVAAPYLHDAPHRMKLRDVTPAGSQVVFMNNEALYEGRAVVPTISQNMLTQLGTGNVAAGFTLVLPEPAAKVQFLIPHLFPDTQSGVTFPAWKAIALGASGDALDTRQKALARRLEDNIPGDLVTLEAPAFEGIASVRFESDPRLGGQPFAAFSALLIEGLWFEPMAGAKR